MDNYWEFENSRQNRWGDDRYDRQHWPEDYRQNAYNSNMHLSPRQNRGQYYEDNQRQFIQHPYYTREQPNYRENYRNYEPGYWQDHGYTSAQSYGSYDPYGTTGYGSMRGMQNYDRNQRSSYDMGGSGNRSGNDNMSDNRTQNRQVNYRTDYYPGGNTYNGDYMGSGYSRQTHGEYGPMLNYGRNYESYTYRNSSNRGQHNNRHEGPVRTHSRID